RIEVVRGPMSLLYGASALGGVVNVIRDEVPTSRVEGVHATLVAQGNSVNRGGSMGGAVSLGRGALALRLDGSARGSGDTRTPLGPLVNTGVAEYTFAAGLSRLGERGHVGGSYRFYGNDYGIPGGFVGGHATGVDIVMRRHTGRLDADLHVARRALENLRVTATLSDYGHSELEQSGAVGTRFDQRQFTTEAVARHRPVGALGSGAVGVRVQGRDIRTGGTLSTPSTRTYGAALFAVEEATHGALTLQLGGRYEFARYEPQERSFIDVGGQRIPTRDRQFGALAGSLGALWRVSDGVRVGTSVSRAFRSPEFDELYSNGPHLAANSYDVGDPSLRAETGLGFDAFVRVNRGRAFAEFAAFRSRLDGYVFPSSRGRSELGAQGGRPRFQFTNEDAVFSGAEGRVEWSATSALVLDATASYVRARFTSTRDSIPVITPDTSYFIGASGRPPFVPPLNGSVGVRYDRTRWFVSGQLRGAARQERLGDFEDPTAGYVVPSFGAGVRFVRGAQLHAITLRLDNAFDQEFRDHLSRIKAVRPEAGRNVSLLYRLTM
ncbi:MAG TPA: TonB-dependent receptor, partial [Gemmatimonadaceae bacterium]|nr:TonB-dependent receptor [Gemmatimonadaceae bacterium]